VNVSITRNGHPRITRITRIHVLDLGGQLAAAKRMCPMTIGAANDPSEPNRRTRTECSSSPSWRATYCTPQRRAFTAIGAANDPGEPELSARRTECSGALFWRATYWNTTTLRVFPRLGAPMPPNGPDSNRRTEFQDRYLPTDFPDTSAACISKIGSSYDPNAPDNPMRLTGFQDQEEHPCNPCNPWISNP
jgi:hypothetical protein